MRTKNKKSRKKETLINREHKDRLFKRLFGSADNRASMLSLYNALNDSNYTDETMLQIYTIEDAVYMGMKNDIGYILDSYICLHEQQSTYNPNMPLRGFLYHAKMYEKFLIENNIDINTSKLKKIPSPQFYVFCNDPEFKEEKAILHLSDAFIQPIKSGEFEWTAIMLNINLGHNIELMQKCETLNSYATFIDKIRSYTASGYPLEEAVNYAVDWCIRNNILAEYLKKHKSEVIGMVLTEYDEKKTMNNIYVDGFNDGRFSEIQNTEKEKRRADEAEARNAALIEEINALKKQLGQI